MGYKQSNCSSNIPSEPRAVSRLETPRGKGCSWTCVFNNQFWKKITWSHWSQQELRSWMNKEPVNLEAQQPQFCWESRWCHFCRWDAKSAPCAYVPGKRHNEIYLLKDNNQSNISILCQKKCLRNFIFSLSFLLPSFGSFVYGFALSVACQSPCWDPCPGHAGLASLSDSAWTRQQAPCGKFITVKPWHFLISVVGTSHQQELSPPPRLRPKHNGLQKRGRVNVSDRALHTGILDVFSRLIWITLLWNTVLIQLPAVRSVCRHMDRSDRLISYFLKKFMFLNLAGWENTSRWGIDEVSSLNFSSWKGRTEVTNAAVCFIL